MNALILKPLLLSYAVLEIVKEMCQDIPDVNFTKVFWGAFWDGVLQDINWKPLKNMQIWKRNSQVTAYFLEG